MSLESAEDDSRLNLTLDTSADYAFISAIFDALFAERPCFGWHDVKHYCQTVRFCRPALIGR